MNVQLGVLVYQEHISKIFHELGGFTKGEADKVRKAVSKKTGLTEEQMDKFVEGATENGMKEEVAKKLVKQVEKFGKYGFPKSHAAAYALIAYWCQWLKVYYPQAFFWALLKHEPKREEVNRFSGEAQRRGVDILPVNVNWSGAEWSIDGDGLRSSISEIKQVGPVSIGAITEAQPFDDLVDFFTRVTGRQANARVVTNLTKAGAMTDLLPNTKWALEFKASWLGTARDAREGWEDEIREAVTASRELVDYNPEDMLSLALEVSPPSTGRTLLDVYRPLFEGSLSHLDFTEIDADDYYGRSHAFIRGIVLDCRWGQVPDKSDAGKPKLDAGMRFANLDLIDERGNRRRIKVQSDAVARFPELETIKGKAIVAYVQIQRRYHTTWALYLTDLETLRQKLQLGVKFSPWETCFLEPHPVRTYSGKSLERKMNSFHSFNVVALITYVRLYLDKNHDTMAFVGFQDAHGYGTPTLCFSSVFENHRTFLEPGNVVEVSLRHWKNTLVVADEGVLRLIGKLGQ